MKIELDGDSVNHFRDRGENKRLKSAASFASLLILSYMQSEAMKSNSPLPRHEMFDALDAKWQKLVGDYYCRASLYEDLQPVIM